LIKLAKILFQQNLDKIIRKIILQDGSALHLTKRHKSIEKFNQITKEYFFTFPEEKKNFSKRNHFKSVPQ